MNPVPVPSIIKCVEAYGVLDGEKLHKMLISSGFRSAPSLHAQILFLKNVIPEIPVRTIMFLLGLSTRAYYKALKSDTFLETTVVVLPKRKLLSEDEEIQICTLIREQQCLNDCFSGKDIRDIASELYKKRTGIDKSFSRDWLCDFRKRHEELIVRVKADSIDDSRSNISLDEVETYLTMINEMMKNPPDPLLLINFDETGFGRRPEKGKRKYVYIHKNCNIKAFWREKTDQHHISVVSCITAACTCLKPLCLSTRKTMDEDINDTFFFRWGSYYSTPKGYMNIESMLYWVNTILKPYIASVRTVIGQEKPCYIIADGFKSHFHSNVIQALNEIGYIHLIPLPAHSSHITQMLDVSYFGAVKKKYSVTPGNNEIESKFTRKLLRIKKSFETVTTSELIRTSWEASGFPIHVSNGQVIGFSFSESFKNILIAKTSHHEVE
ncbi:hypothetical protein TRFO_06987 [Tritrichomonas foetus]|uniref:HTH CENPB-type domain-containing protein n=1 Tax=Tritrichomonas foetus TaxID=1144522 RepID=A0A1J4JYI0_9EUKA|nr:hypothetical protein TRFO_06987 [Tritrichomonas foetus]|eukprot:OHT02588.1 hypothetical protein TRFO_06987 [Tritrichomonas foetus]